MSKNTLVIQNLEISSSSGKKIQAKIFLPPFGKPKTYALFAHCFVCTKNENAIHSISWSLGMHKIAVISLDYTSEGIMQSIEDLRDVFEFIEKKYSRPQLFIGHSLGVVALLKLAIEKKIIKAVVCISAAFEKESIEKIMSKQGEDSPQKNVASSIEKDVTAQAKLFNDKVLPELKQKLSRLSTAFLIMHSPIDNIAGIDNAAALFGALKHPRSFISLDNADHMLSNPDDALYAGSTLASWANKYLEIDNTNGNTIETVFQTAVRTGKQGYTTEIVSGKHQLIADEPIEVGGNDFGPGPYDFLLAALGSCTSMTLRMYADRKKIPLEEIVVHLDHKKIHAKDCMDCESESGKIDVIERAIELHGELNDEQRNALLEIADKCPVHRTIHSEIKVRSTLVKK